jgi:hypothetical protein
MHAHTYTHHTPHAPHTTTYQVSQRVDVEQLDAVDGQQLSAVESDVTAPHTHVHTMCVVTCTVRAHTHVRELLRGAVERRIAARARRAAQSAAACVSV